MTTIATLLSGGEGVGVGARAAGLKHLWGIEIDDAIAQVARNNGFNIVTGDIMDVDPYTLEVPDVLHASPECQNASSAKHDPGAETLEEKETRLDKEIAACIVRYLEILQPRVFTLENVYPYRKFQSFKMIMLALNRLGYFTHLANLNAANFGVPQTRKRLILRAVHGGLVPMLPAPEPWVGWYSVIEDLISTLPESKFAPWQMARLGNIITTDTLFAQGSYDDGLIQRGRMEPAVAMTANNNQTGLRAFIANGSNASRPLTVRSADEPMFTVDGQGMIKHPERAFIVGGQFGKPSDGSGEPRIPQVKDEGEPVFCVTAVNKGDWRAWLSRGRVVKMTPRCLARFQSFPDSYQLPDRNGLACRVIGNAVPPLLYEKLVRSLS